MRDRSGVVRSSSPSSGEPEPACRVDPGPEHEARRVGIGPAPQAGGIGKGGEPDIVAPAHDLKALRHQRPVEAGERHHVTDRGQRHQVEPFQEIGLGDAGAAVVVGAFQA